MRPFILGRKIWRRADVLEVASDLHQLGQLSMARNARPVALLVFRGAELLTQMVEGDVDVETQCIACNENLEDQEEHICEHCGQGMFCEACLEQEDHNCSKKEEEEDL